jgi:nucleoside-diphosphate-sugar epimerase
MVKRIAVTGSEGKLGRYVVRELNEYGYEVIGLDARPPESGNRYSRYMKLDLNRLGEVYAGLAGADAVIHLAAVPNPVEYAPERIFANNVLSTYHVLEAAARLGVGTAVIGSSESAYGFCWAPEPFDPLYFPVDEEHPLLPRECYGLSKEVGESIGDMFSRRSGMRVFAMRFAHILAPEQYEKEIAAFADTRRHHRILWSYIDVRDAAAACRLAVECGAEGSVRLDVTADDLLSDVPPAELAARYYPGVGFRVPPERLAALVSNRCAREALGWKPVHSWKEYA